MTDSWSLVHGCAFQDLGADTTISAGMAFTTSASANTKGTWQQLGTTTLAHPCNRMILTGRGVGVGIDHAVDIGVGTTGNEKILFSNLPYMNNGTASQNMNLVLPCNLPAGTQLNLRHQASTGSNNFNCNVKFEFGNWNTPFAGGTVDTYGVTVSGSTTATALTASTANNEPASYTQITASTTRAHKALLIILGSRTNATANWAFIDVAVGAAASEKDIITDFFFQNPANWAKYMGGMWIPCNIPAGSRLSARMRSDQNAVVRDIAILGLS